MHLALTLGHNSSAVLISDDGHILIGYEEERLSKIKSDSHFPKKSILEIGKFYDLDKVREAHVSHWATDGDVDTMSIKHWNKMRLRKLVPNAMIYADYNHHDCHVGSLRAFAGRTCNWEIVSDGFGNFNETTSIYHKGKLVNRLFGFDTSIGLLYQYTTSFLGLKMNQDEFKLLGYESMIFEVLSSDDIATIKELAAKEAVRRFKRVETSTLEHKFDCVASLSALPNIRMDIRHKCTKVLAKLGVSAKDLHTARVALSHYVQCVTEHFFKMLVSFYMMDDVGLSGGVFLNVKLNNVIAKEVGSLTVTPLCGDQGCGIGAYHFRHGDLKWPGNLFWGKRSLDFMKLLEPRSSNYFGTSNHNLPKIFFNEEAAKKEILEQLMNNNIVNVIRDAMEFGPRALGNTSTLAMPTLSNVEKINRLNSRSTIMPMAGMVTKSELVNYVGADKVHESSKYMIVTLDRAFSDDVTQFNRGCHHQDPCRGVYTNRVQLLDEDHFLYDIVSDVGMIINTSFNTHGVPIVYDEDDILNTHDQMTSADWIGQGTESGVVTVVIV